MGDGRGRVLLMHVRHQVHVSSPVDSVSLHMPIDLKAVVDQRPGDEPDAVPRGTVLYASLTRMFADSTKKIRPVSKYCRSECPNALKPLKSQRSICRFHLNLDINQY